MKLLLQQHQGAFFFWGKRTYVHGSHMLYGLLEAAKAAGLEPLTRVVASFRSHLTSQGRYLFFESADAFHNSGFDFPAFFELTTPAGAAWAGLTPGGGDVVDRKACDEEALIKGCRIDAAAGTAFLESYDAEKWINVLIALTKRLHAAVFSTAHFGPWFLGKIELAPQVPAQTGAGPISMTITRHIAEKMTQSRLEMGGVALGNILFNRKVLA